MKTYDERVWEILHAHKDEAGNVNFESALEIGRRAGLKDPKAVYPILSRMELQGAFRRGERNMFVLTGVPYKRKADKRGGKRGPRQIPMLMPGSCEPVGKMPWRDVQVWKCLHAYATGLEKIIKLNGAQIGEKAGLVSPSAAYSILHRMEYCGAIAWVEPGYYRLTGRPYERRKFNMARFRKKIREKYGGKRRFAAEKTRPYIPSHNRKNAGGKHKLERSRDVVKKSMDQSLWGPFKPALKSNAKEVPEALAKPGAGGVVHRYGRLYFETRDGSISPWTPGQNKRKP